MQKNIKYLTELNTIKKRQYLPHYLSAKSFKGIVVNQAWSSLHGDWRVLGQSKLRFNLFILRSLYSLVALFFCPLFFGPFILRSLYSSVPLFFGPFILLSLYSSVPLFFGPFILRSSLHNFIIIYSSKRLNLQNCCITLYC